MQKISIFGAGGFGQEVASILIETIKYTNEKFEFIGFFDDSVKEENIYGKVLGNIEDLNNYSESLNVYIGIGNPNILYKVTNKLNNTNLQFPNLIHPSIQYLDFSSSHIGFGNIISVNVIISNKVTIGNFNILNTRVTIAHDATIGNCNVFNPNTQICGGVLIGNQNLFGFNSGVMQTKRIGNCNVLGAGSILLKSIGDAETYVGKPATKLNF